MHQYRLARRLLALLIILTTFSVLFSSTPLPASSTQPFTPTPSQQTQSQIIESDDPLVVQEGSWTSQNTPQASGGSYLYSSGSAYDTLTLHFYGSRIEVIYAEYPSFGGFTVEIDGDARRTVFSDSKETVFGSRAVFDYLELAPHTLRIMGIQGTVAIDAFYGIPYTPSSDEENAGNALSSSVRFIPNMGQFDDGVRFEAQGANRTAYYMDDEVVLVLPPPPADQIELTDPTLRPEERSNEKYVPDFVRMQFEGSTTDPTILSLQRLPGEINYFIGNDDSDWHTNVPIYGAIVYEDLYPGVDVVFDETSGALQGTFTIDGGVDLSQIRWRYEGVTHVRVDEITGELLFDVVPNPARTEQAEAATPVEHRQPALSAWQTAGDQRSSTPIDLHYTVDKDGMVGFAAQGYNAAQPLMIALFSGGGMMEAAVVEEPPSEIGFSSYLGGSASIDYILDVAGDSTGNIYVTGNMPSSAISGGIIGVGGTSSTFVAKFNSDNSLGFITYIGGSSADYSEGIDVDSSGNTYITGYTASADFPTLDAYQATCTLPSGCGWEAFVVKISANGSTLLYGTYLGDTSTDWARAIAVDDNNQVYVTGFTDTVNDWNDCTYPYCDNDAKGHDFFVVKLDLNKSGTAQLEYGSIWGGRGTQTGVWDDDPTDIAIDSQGNVVVVGYTESGDFPITPGVFCETPACGSSFVTVFVAVNDTLGFYRSSRLGGTGNTQAHSVAFDAASNVYIVGETGSTDFSTPNGTQTSSINDLTYYTDGFLAKMPFDLSTVTYGTYLSGGDNDRAFGVDVNEAGIAYVTGSTDSTNFPTTANAMYPTSNGGQDTFFARFDTNQSGSDSLLESTYWGGSGHEQGHGIAEENGTFYIAGNTTSSDLPIVDGYSHFGAGDGFMMRGTSFPFCVVEVKQARNYYDSPILAQTERIQDIQRAASSQHYAVNTQLYLDFRYRNDDFIFRVSKINTAPTILGTYSASDPWTNVNPVWISKQPFPSTPNPIPVVVSVTNGRDCQNLIPHIPNMTSYELKIAAIREFGIDIQEDRNLWASSPQTLWTGWSEDELLQLSTGLTDISLAFDSISVLQHQFSKEFTFKNAMGRYRQSESQINPPCPPSPISEREDCIDATANIDYYTFVRVPANGTGPDGIPHNGICKTYNDYSQIVCFGPLLNVVTSTTRDFTRYTAVHELGHAFDARASSPNSTNPRLIHYMDRQGVLVQDCGIPGQRQPIYFVGEASQNSWTRGEKGWGSGPARNATPPTRSNMIFSDFQQNPVLVIQQNNRTERIEEGAADMFLNWVYRRNHYGQPPADPCQTPLPVPSHWQGLGFLNEDWTGILSSTPIPGTADPSLPGDTFYKWFDEIMVDIFGRHTW